MRLPVITNAVRKRTEKSTTKQYVVETAYGTRGHYEIKYSFDTLREAEFWYHGLLVHSGYKKRLIDMKSGTIIRRVIS